MRLLKRQPGLPFLLALGVLLILSASFLAVQLWSEDAFRGAAEALEAPMLPPPLPVGKKSGAKASSGKKNEQKPVATVEVVSAPEIQKLNVEEPVSAPIPVVEPVKAPDMVEAPAMPEVARPASTVKAKDAVSSAKAAVVQSPKPASEAKPLQAEPVGATVEKSLAAPAKDVVVSESSQVANNAATANVSVRKVGSKKVRAARKAAEEAEGSEIPPEWNWFNTPLRLELSGSNIEIVPAGTPRDVALVSVVARLPDGLFGDAIEPLASQSEPELNLEADIAPVPVTQKPFVAALAKMAKLRHGRMASIEADPELEKAAAAHRSRSIEELRLVVASLRSRLEVGSPVADQGVPATAVAADLAPDADSYVPASDVVAPEAASDEADVAVEVSTSIRTSDDSVEAVIDAGSTEDSEFKFVPYYGGSGTPMSGRINTLLQRGVGYRPR